jgi:hypothetical protein
MFKNRNCFNFIQSQKNLVQRIANLNNEEVIVFMTAVKESSIDKDKGTNSMDL